MKIGIFHPFHGGLPNDWAMRGLQLGFLEHEHESEVYMVRSGNYVPCDVAIRWGIPSIRHAQKTAYRRYIDEEHKGPIGMVELGWLGDRNKHFLFGFGSTNGRGKYYLPDREYQLKKFEDLKIRVPKRVRSKGRSHVLICGQVPWDTAVQRIDYHKWVQKTIITIHKLAPSMPIVFREHPKARGAVQIPPSLRKYVTISKRLTSLKDDLAKTRCVVVFNSNAALDAMLAGIPAITMDEGSMVHGLTSHDLQAIENPMFPSRNQFRERLIEIANSQWTIEEFEKNIPWQVAKEQIRYGYT